MSANSPVPSLGNGVTRPIPRSDYARWLEHLRCDSPGEAGTEFFIDWAGVRTRVPMLEWAPAELAGQVSTDLPIPDDGYRSEDFEYVALARSFEQRPTSAYAIVEVGAAWAPWTVSGLIHARRLGIPALGVALEADSRKCAWSMQHAKDNNLDAILIDEKPSKISKALTRALGGIRPNDQTMVIVRAAGWVETTTVSFPDTGVEDMGTAVQTNSQWNVDYRGAHLRHSSVPAISLAELLPILAGPSGFAPTIDLLHIDVQGVEFELLEPLAGAIQDHTRLMAVGTHSRLNEGLLQDFFLRRGWGIVIDEPCKAEFVMTHPTLAGFTWQDGMQLWENPFVL